MIPKRIIHCWFGGPMPDGVKANIEGWGKVCPDYEIVRVDEDSYDIGSDPLAAEAYREGRWALVADRARFDALRRLGGGFYLDSDIRLLRPLDRWCGESAIVCEMFPGYYSNHVLGCGEEYPMLYEWAEKSGELPEKALNRLMYALAPDLMGQSFLRTPFFTAIGMRYAHPSGRSGNYAMSDEAVLVHEVGGTGVRWRKGGKGSKPEFSVVIDGCVAVESDSELVLTVPSSEYDEDAMSKFGEIGPFRYVDMANYFQNPNVVEVSVNGATMRRKHPTEGRIAYYCTWLGARVGCKVG